jgi:O-antigen/teichoic acid export membrane protein
MVRYVPKDELGMYFLILAIVHFLKIVGGLGLDLTLVRFISNEDARAQQDAFASIIVTRTILLVSISIIVYLVGSSVLPVFDERLNDYLPYIPMMFALTSFRELFFHLMQGFQKFKEYAFVQLLSALLKFVLVLMLSTQLSLLTLIYVELGTLFSSLLVQLFVARFKLFGLSIMNISRESMQSVIKFSVPLYCDDILTFVYDRSSVFLIGAFLDPASIAAYEVALKIPAGFMRMFRSFIVVYFPSLSRLFSQGNRSDAQKVMNRSLVLFSTGIVFLVLVSFLFGREIIVLVFSDEYREVSMAFALLMLNFYLRAVSNILGYSLVSAGYPSAPAKVNTVACTVNVVGSLIMIQEFGFVGAVYSLLLMNITSQTLYYLYLVRIEVVVNALNYLKPLLLLIPMIGIHLLLGREMIVVKPLLVTLYLVLSWLFIEGLRESVSFALRHVVKLTFHTEST